MTTSQNDQRIIKLVHANPMTTTLEIKEQIQLNVELKIVKTRLHKASLFGRNKLILVK